MASVGDVVRLLRSRGVPVDAKAVVAAHCRMLRPSWHLGGTKQLLLWPHHSRRARRANCVYCRSPVRAGVWCATCDVVACMECVRKQMGTTFAVVAEAHFAHWRCNECAAVALGEPRPVRSWRALYEGQRARGRWACLKCTYLSAPTASACGACGWEPTISRPLVGALPGSMATGHHRLNGLADVGSGIGADLAPSNPDFAVQAANPKGRVLPLPVRQQGPFLGSAPLPNWPTARDVGMLLKGGRRELERDMTRRVGAAAARDVVMRALLRVQGQVRQYPESSQLERIITALMLASDRGDKGPTSAESHRQLLTQWNALLVNQPQLASAVGAARTDVAALIARASEGHHSLRPLAQGSVRALATTAATAAGNAVQPAVDSGMGVISAQP